MPTDKIFAATLPTLAGALLAGFTFGCSEGTADGMAADDGSGGTSSSASSTSGSGATASTGTDGSTGTSGSAGTDGSTGSSGSSGGGPSEDATMLWDFSDGPQNWAFNFADRAASDDLGANTTVEWDTEDDATPGSDTPGSLLVTIPFTESDERVGIAVNIGLAIDEMGEAVDMTGKMLHAKVKLVEGFGTNPDVPGGAKFYVKTGPDYALANHGWTNMDLVGQWVSLTLDVSNPGGYVDPVSDSKPNPYTADDVREVGVEFAASDAAGGTWTTAVVRIDDVWF